MKRYEKLTEEITGSILSGLLQAGDRLPSVRQTSASRGVSPSTVFKAYYLLEARGLIRARDRSGYHVRAPQATLPELEAVSSAAAVRHPVDVSDKVLQVLNATLRRDMLPFGSAFPIPRCCPMAGWPSSWRRRCRSSTPGARSMTSAPATPRCAAPSRCATWPTA